MSACDFAWATQFWYEELLLPPPSCCRRPECGARPCRRRPERRGPESRAAPRSSAIGFALDGAVIVCGWFTSLSVIEKLRLIFETDAPALEGGAIDSETRQLA